MREGAFDYVAKPFDNDELRARGRPRARADAPRAREPLAAPGGRRAATRPSAIVAESPRSHELLALRAPRRAEPRHGAGAGRERHRQGAGGAPAALLERSRRPAVRRRRTARRSPRACSRASCSATRRAPSPAPRPRAPGCFERADGGTLFLDEIGEVGAATSRRSCCACCRRARCCASAAAQPRARRRARWSRATNRVLRDEVAAGRFREDLFFRLNVDPDSAGRAARAARGHPARCARHFLDRHATRGRRRRHASGADAEAAPARTRRGSGNVRELENAVERAVVLARGEEITPRTLLLEQPSVTRRPRSSRRHAAGLRSTAPPPARIRRGTRRGRRAARRSRTRLGIERTTLYRMDETPRTATGTAVRRQAVGLFSDVGERSQANAARPPLIGTALAERAIDWAHRAPGMSSRATGTSCRRAAHREHLAGRPTRAEYMRCGA